MTRTSGFSDDDKDKDDDVDPEKKGEEDLLEG